MIDIAILKLPILKKDNKSEYPKWHAYYEKVYKKIVTEDVDLNTFSWFYWYSPLNKVKCRIVYDLNIDNIKINEPYIFKTINKTAPENMMSKIGFFVKRELNLEKISNSKFLEVQRTNQSVYFEKGVIWFFLAIGSGIYLKCDNNFIGTRKELDWPNEFKNTHNKQWHLLQKKNIFTFIIYPSIYYGKFNLIEIVYRLENKNTIANTANIPLFINGIPYKHIYHPNTKCMYNYMPLTISNLPILKKDNKSEYPKWHAYYEKVYKKGVTEDVDLNTFNWFYWYSPLGKIDVYNISNWNSIIKRKLNLPLNTPFILTYCNYAAENIFCKYGFFIKKNLKIPKNIIEVNRVNNSIFVEKGVCWFFYIIGSGIYLKFDKCFIGERNNIEGWCEKNPFQSLKNKNINTFIINKGWCDIIGLIEIVYRLENEDIIANTAKLPLFRNGKSYEHKYDKTRYSLMI